MIDFNKAALMFHVISECNQHGQNYQLIADAARKELVKMVEELKPKEEVAKPATGGVPMPPPNAPRAFPSSTPVDEIDRRA